MLRRACNTVQRERVDKWRSRPDAHCFLGPSDLFLKLCSLCIYKL